MSQILTLELNDEVFDAIKREANQTGASPAQVAASSLERNFVSLNGKRIDTRSEAEKQAARERFRRHIGAVNLGYPTGADNEEIDRDLARAYGDNHENG